jgi:hypothetical protein
VYARGDWGGREGCERIGGALGLSSVAGFEGRPRVARTIRFFLEVMAVSS